MAKRKPKKQDPHKAVSMDMEAHERMRKRKEALKGAKKAGLCKKKKCK